jgi:hypothetical protein
MRFRYSRDARDEIREILKMGDVRDARIQWEIILINACSLCVFNSALSSTGHRSNTGAKMTARLDTPILDFSALSG